MAAQGLRILGVAKATFDKSDLPSIQHDFDFKFIGLLGLEDPVRESVPAAVKECHEAGIRVVMITGDYPLTAANIGRQIGFENVDNIITGAELSRMGEDELAQKIRTTNIFARVVPEQKLMIVKAFKKNDEIAAMTGDGVNDAPALKAAHIGIAMGERGTDVAREASKLVLLKDDFGSIVGAVAMGRRIFDNLKKAMGYIVAVHIPIAGLSIIPVLLQWNELILFPVHIVFLELIIDPACSVVFESEPADKGIMKRKPRKATERLFDKSMVLVSFLQGIVSMLTVLAVNMVAKEMGQTDAQARTLAFVALIISNLCMIMANRSWTQTMFQRLFVKNATLKFVLGGALAFLAAVVFVPFLRGLFHFAPVSLPALAIAIGAGCFSVLWFEIMKIFKKKKV
jgi:Ca2+-transporting ATPase